MLKNDTPKHLKVPLLESRERLFDVPRKKLKIFPNKGAKGSQKELQRAPQITENHIKTVKNAHREQHLEKWTHLRDPGTAKT
jgi:hypothetical protein